LKKSYYLMHVMVTYLHHIMVTLLHHKLVLQAQQNVNQKVDGGLASLRHAISSSLTRKRVGRERKRYAKSTEDLWLY